MKTEIVLGQSSWQIAADRVALAVTEWGGFMAPVNFQLGSRVVAPYSIPPWAGRSEAPGDALGALRGDAFCLPFGANQTPYRGELHPPHGDPFHARWRCDGFVHDGPRQRLDLSVALQTRTGRVKKEIMVHDEHTVVYQTHRITGLSGRMSFGYHATLDFSQTGAGRLGLSRILFGRTQPANFESAAQGGYTSLRAATVFRRLSRVPRSDGGWTDLTHYPVESGYENLVLLASDPDLPLAWTTVTFAGERFVWFSIKCPRELSCTLLWLSNGGRHYAPWNGRHRARLGLEEVTALPEGLAEAARPNVFSRRGVAVSRRFDARRTYAVRSAAGVCVVPRGFDRVTRLRVLPGRLRLEAASGAWAETGFDDTFFAGDERVDPWK